MCLLYELIVNEGISNAVYAVPTKVLRQVYGALEGLSGEGLRKCYKCIGDKEMNARTPRCARVMGWRGALGPKKNISCNSPSRNVSQLGS